MKLLLSTSSHLRFCNILHIRKTTDNPACFQRRIQTSLVHEVLQMLCVRFNHEAVRQNGWISTRSCHSWEKQPISILSQHAHYCIATQETPRGNFGIFTIVPEGKRGLSYGSGERQEMTGILCGLFENKLVGSLSTARRKLEIRSEDYSLNNPSMAFSLS